MLIILFYVRGKLYSVKLINVKLQGVLKLLALTCPIVCTCLLTFRPGVLSKTLSHTWGKLNLPMFVFNLPMYLTYLCIYLYTL